MDIYECCPDCAMFLANGEVPESRLDLPDHIVARWPGWRLDLHADSDDGFSWSPCECCGDPRAGTRMGFVARMCD